MFFKGGFLVWPILLCSIIGVMVFFERLFSLRIAEDREKTAEKILPLFESGMLSEAKKILETRRAIKKKKISASESILYEAVSMQGSELDTLETVLAHGVEKELNSLYRYMGVLATAGNIAPLLGLLGTVVGMIKAFLVVENMGGKVNAAVLAGGIWEAMLTTAFGLMVAIPLIICHSYLEGRVNIIRTDLEGITVALIKTWNRPQVGEKE